MKLTHKSVFMTIICIIAALVCSHGYTAESLTFLGFGLMAQDIGLDTATGGPAVTLLGSNLSDATRSALTAAVDFGAPQPLECGYEIKLDCQTSSDGFAYLEVAWSHDNADFSDTSNLETVAVIDCTASTVAVKVGSFPIRARYAKFALNNQSGGTINSESTALVLTDLFGDQA